MAKIYESKLTIRCWKEHACVACGATFRYVLSRKITAQGDDATIARANARAAAQKAIARDVEVHPCPTCGLVQPEMIGQARAHAHGNTLWLAVLLPAALLLARGLDSLQANTATWVLTVLCAGLGLLVARDELRSPNRDLARNRSLAAERVSDGILVVVMPGDASADAAKQAVSRAPPLRTAVLAGLVASVVLSASPELLRVARGWPRNADCFPPVAGPGDSVRVYMEDPVYSLRGIWRCSPSVELHVGPVGSQTLTSSCPDSVEWGEIIRAKPTEQTRSSSVSVVFRIPDDAALAGASVTALIKLEVTYPVAQAPDHFTEGTGVRARTVTLELARTPGAGKTYEAVWWGGSLLAIAASLGGAVALFVAARAAQRASTARVLDEDPDADAGEAPPKPRKLRKKAPRKQAS